jgi:hypothetical protein
MSTLAGSRREVFARRWIQIIGFSLAGLATVVVIAPVISSGATAQSLGTS